MLPHADAEESAAAAARPRWWPVAAAAVAFRHRRRRAATIHGRLVGEEMEDSQLTAATAVSSRLKTNLTRSLTLIRSVSCALCHTFSCYNLLARSFVRYLPIKRRRSLAPSTSQETLTHARTYTRRISERPHAHAARRTTIVLFMFVVLYSDPPLARGPSTSSPRRRCNKHKVHRRHQHRRRNMVLVRGPIIDALGSV